MCCKGELWLTILTTHLCALHSEYDDQFFRASLCFCFVSFVVAPVHGRFVFAIRLLTMAFSRSLGHPSVLLVWPFCDRATENKQKHWSLMYVARRANCAKGQPQRSVELVALRNVAKNPCITASAPGKKSYCQNATKQYHAGMAKSFSPVFCVILVFFRIRIVVRFLDSFNNEHFLLSPSISRGDFVGDVRTASSCTMRKKLGFFL